MQQLPEAGLPDLSARRSRLLGDSSRHGVVLSTASTIVVLAVLLALFLLVSLAVILTNVITDLTYAWLDPRIRYD